MRIIVCLLLAVTATSLISPYLNIERYRRSTRCQAVATKCSNDLILRTARGEKTEKSPVWVFRQAGRHLPEYNDYKTRTKKTFLELLQDPVHVTECTLQPVRRYNVDAAILFSDILVILQAIGIDVTMPGGQGITVPSPISCPADYLSRVDRQVDIHSRLSHVLHAVSLITQELRGRIPLIGFSAAPWTLFFYLVGGSSKRNQHVASSWLATHPIPTQEILTFLSDIVVEYLVAQVDNGADIVQLFEAMGEYLSPADFRLWALPYLNRIAVLFKTRCPNTPLMIFPRGASHCIEDLQSFGYDVVSIDTKTNRHDARQRLHSASLKQGLSQPAVLQGNFDVRHLAKDNPVNTPQRVRNSVREMLQEFGSQHLIANLGGGLTGSEDPVLVEAFVNSVHELSCC